MKYAAGTEPIAMLFAKAVEADVPDVANEYEQPAVRLLVSLCRELQRHYGTEPFFIDSRTAGRLLDVDPSTAWRWLRLLGHDGILKEVAKGSLATRKASQFRYLAAI